MIPDTSLQYVRTINLGDDAIDIEIELNSNKDFKLKELYEAFPVFCDNRKIYYNTDGRFFEWKLPHYLVTPSHKSLDGVYRGENPNIKPIKTDKLKLTAENGSGILIELPEIFSVTAATPLRYRKEASNHEWIILCFADRMEEGADAEIQISY